MRIIAGQCGGAQLYAPRGMDTRPTQDKVKESLFSIIQAYVPGARVLDLFAGSGALALEALSRGADFAALADRDREAVSCIRRNGEKLRFMDAMRIYAHHSLIVLIVNHQSGNSDARQQASPQAFKAEQHTGDQIDHRNGKHAQHALERQLPGILSMP